jgi:tetratricopeptide (TPR) repeat protein
LQALVGDDSSLVSLKRTLIAHTEGNPLFLEESVRTLVESGGLVGERGAYHLISPLDSLQVPATVQAVLAARIDRLPSEEKRLLQIAAVVGTEVPWPLLQAIAELPDDTLHRSVAHLQTAEFLYETRLFPEHEYTFKHTLTHEVAYSSLLQERRRALHAHIVEAIEALVGDRVAEQVERLAHHALRGELWDKAVTYSRQAAEKALARPAYREAVGYFEQALSALPHLPERRDIIEQAIDLRLALRSALLPSGDFGRILPCLREAEALAAALDDPHRLAQVSLFLSNHFRFMGTYDQAVAAADRALAIATASRHAVLHARANYFLGLVSHSQGDYPRAIDCLRQTVAFFAGARQHERFGQVSLPAVMSRARLAACHAELGTFVEGRAVGEEGLQIAEEAGHPATLMMALWGIGLLAFREGDLPRALPLLERAMSLCQEVDIPVWFPSIAPTLGAAYTLGGRSADAVPLLTQAIEQTTAMETRAMQVLCHLSLGEAQVLTGRLDEAHAFAERALVLAHERQERGHQAYALRLLGDIAARHEPPDVGQATVHYRQALTLTEELGMRPLEAHCHYGLGTVYAKHGQREQARAELSAAIDLYRAMDMIFWLPQTEATLAQVG